MLEELGQLKEPMTSQEIEPATFLLAAYIFYQVRYRVPILVYLLIHLIYLCIFMY
jgi:hypothetical protein